MHRRRPSLEKQARFALSIKFIHRQSNVSFIAADRNFSIASVFVRCSELYRRKQSVMRSSLAVLVVVACIAVVCESAAVSKQQRDTAADDMTEWLSELSSRSIGSFSKQLAVEQKHKRAVSVH